GGARSSDGLAHTRPPETAGSALRAQKTSRGGRARASPRSCPSAGTTFFQGGEGMLKQEKERVVAELVERLKASDTLLIADYRGLDMKEIDAVRTKLLEHGARFSVVKNTLTRRAA